MENFALASRFSAALRLFSMIRNASAHKNHKTKGKLKEVRARTINFAFSIWSMPQWKVFEYCCFRSENTIKKTEQVLVAPFFFFLLLLLFLFFYIVRRNSWTNYNYTISQHLLRLSKYGELKTSRSVDKKWKTTTTNSKATSENDSNLFVCFFFQSRKKMFLVLLFSILKMWIFFCFVRYWVDFCLNIHYQKDSISAFVLHVMVLFVLFFLVFCVATRANTMRMIKQITRPVARIYALIQQQSIYVLFMSSHILRFNVWLLCFVFDAVKISSN